MIHQQIAYHIIWIIYLPFFAVEGLVRGTIQGIKLWWGHRMWKI